MAPPIMITRGEGGGVLCSMDGRVDGNVLFFFLSFFERGLMRRRRDLSCAPWCSSSCVGLLIGRLVSDRC